MASPLEVGFPSMNPPDSSSLQPHGKVVIRTVASMQRSTDSALHHVTEGTFTSVSIDEVGKPPLGKH